MVTTGNWDYKEGGLHLYNPTGSNRAFTIEKKCSKNYMEWLYKFENWEDGVQTYWCKEIYTWTR